MRTKKQRIRDTVLHSVVTVLCLVFIVLCMLIYMYNNASNDGKKSLHIQTSELKNDIEAQFTANEESLVALSNVVSRLQNDETRDLSLLFDAFEPVGLIDNVAVLLPDNLLYTKRGYINVVSDVSFEQESKKGIYVSGVVEDMTNPVIKIVRMAVPVKSGDEIISILYGAISIDKFEERYKSIAEAYGAEMSIVCNEEPVYESTEGVFNSLYDYENIEYSNDGEGFIEHYFERTHTSYYGHFAPLSVEGWNILLSVPKKNVFAQAYNMARQLIIMFVIWVVAAALFLFFILKRIRKDLEMSKYISDTRKFLLDSDKSDDHITRALQNLVNFSNARSGFFIDSTGEDYNYIAPDFETKLLRGDEREHFKNTLIGYADENKINDDVAVNVYKIFADETLKQTNNEFYNFMIEKDFNNIVFVSSINRDSLVTICGIINGKKPKAEGELLGELAVCISMAIFNKRYLKRIEAIAVTDALTETFNRLACNRDIEQLSDGVSELFACIYIDVNELHRINNKYGHAAGDRMLVFIADALKKIFSKNRVYRMGGDEFLVFTDSIKQDELERKIEDLHETIMSSGYHISVGFDYFTGHESIDELIVEAEKRMYAAKAEYYLSKNEKKLDNTNSGENKHIKVGMPEIDKLVEVIGKHYHGVFSVSMKKDSFSTVTAALEFQKYAEFTDSFKEFFLCYAYEETNRDYYRELVNFLRYDVIQNIISNGKIPSIVYERVDGSNILLSIFPLENGSMDDGNTLWLFEKI